MLIIGFLVTLDLYNSMTIPWWLYVIATFHVVVRAINDIENDGGWKWPK